MSAVDIWYETKMQAFFAELIDLSRHDLEDRIKEWSEVLPRTEDGELVVYDQLVSECSDRTLRAYLEQRHLEQLQGEVENGQHEDYPV
jgi:ribosome-binding protein aMBF1 (putative translation factor)